MRLLVVGPRSAEQRFGVALAAALGLLAISETNKGADKPLCVSLFTASLGVIVITLSFPRALRPLHKGWLYFGETLGRFVSPIVLGVIFFGLITPLAIALRLFGRDELHLRRHHEFLLDRTQPGLFVRGLF